MKISNRGFTLPELMVVLAIAAAILGIGVPNFRDFQRNNRLTVAANDTLGGVITSRAEALRRQVTISMCPSADPLAVNATCGSGSGWIVFEDTDGNCVRADTEELITGVRSTTTSRRPPTAAAFLASTDKRRRRRARDVLRTYCDKRGTHRKSRRPDSAARRRGPADRPAP
jgi:type IV fimbrial biogenesis protein FimT